MMRSVLEYLEASVSRRPEGIAVVDEGGDHSYRDLLEASRSAGSSLASEGIEGRPVMIVGEKGFSLLAAMFGVLFAGGFYVPVDPGMPADRMRSIFTCLREPLIVADCDSATAWLPNSVLIDSSVSDTRASTAPYSSCASAPRVSLVPSTDKSLTRESRSWPVV